MDDQKEIYINYQVISILDDKRVEFNNINSPQELSIGEKYQLTNKKIESPKEYPKWEIFQIYSIL